MYYFTHFIFYEKDGNLLPSPIVIQNTAKLKNTSFHKTTSPVA